MHLSHLGLPIRDERRSRDFYETYFRFDPATAQRYEDGTVIIRNADGFDLALHVGEDVGRIPPFLHFGFRLSHPAGVRALLARLERDGVDVVERYEEPAYVGFKCVDPDGYQVEAYWERAVCVED